MKRLLALLLALSAALAAVAAPVDLVDDAGQRVQLPAPARRIVAITPHLTEMLFAAGAGDRVVGVSAWSDYPAAAKSLPQVGDSALLDLERIVALRPDLVLVWGNGSSAQQIQRLRAARLPVFVSESRTLAHVATTLRQLGRLAGTEAVAEARAADYERRLAELRARFAGRKPLVVFYQVWHQPLMTFNREHVVDEALRLCGAVNPFAALKTLTPTVDVEAVMLADPDAIVTGSVDPTGSDNLDRWRSLKSLRAGRDPRRLIVVDPDRLHRSTDRLADGIEELCLKLDALR